MYPALFNIGSIIVLALWFFVALGFFTSGFLFIKLSLYNKLKISFLIEHFFAILLYGLIGARLLYLILQPEMYFYKFSLGPILKLLMIWDNGLNFWGGAVGIVIGLYHYAKEKQENFKKWLDMLTLSMLGGLIFGHIGAFLDGVNFGKETSLPWGMTFYNLNIPYAIPIHPTQLYALLYTMIIFVSLLILNMKKKIVTPGMLSAAAIFSYSTMRFLEEFVRGDSFYEHLSIAPAHLITTPIIIISGLYIILGYNRRNTTDNMPISNTNTIPDANTQ